MISLFHNVDTGTRTTPRPQNYRCPLANSPAFDCGDEDWRLAASHAIAPARQDALTAIDALIAHVACARQQEGDNDFNRRGPDSFEGVGQRHAAFGGRPKSS